MIRRPPRSTRTDTLFPYTTLFRSHLAENVGLLTRIQHKFVKHPATDAERPRTVRPGSDADQPQASLDAAAAGNDAVGSIAHAFGNEQLFGLFQPIVEQIGRAHV